MKPTKLEELWEIYLKAEGLSDITEEAYLKGIAAHEEALVASYRALDTYRREADKE